MTPYLPDINEPHLHFSSTLEYRIIEGGGGGLEISPKTNNRGWGGWNNWRGVKMTQFLVV